MNKLHLSYFRGVASFFSSVYYSLLCCCCVFLIHFWFPKHAFPICEPIHCRSLHGNFRSVMTRSKTHRPNDHSYIKALFYFGARLCGPRKLFNEIDNIHTRREKKIREITLEKQREDKKSRKNRCSGRRNQRTENPKTGHYLLSPGWDDRSPAIGRMEIIGPRMGWGERKKTKKKQQQQNAYRHLRLLEILHGYRSLNKLKTRTFCFTFFFFFIIARTNGEFVDLKLKNHEIFIVYLFVCLESNDCVTNCD